MIFYIGANLAPQIAEYFTMHESIGEETFE
jgi:hypothetical protein